MTDDSENFEYLPGFEVQPNGPILVLHLLQDYQEGISQGEISSLLGIEPHAVNCWIAHWQMLGRIRYRTEKRRVYFSYILDDEVGYLGRECL